MSGMNVFFGWRGLEAERPRTLALRALAFRWDKVSKVSRGADVLER